jgi:predicted Holliday junction resolvase-like endonuclease
MGAPIDMIAFDGLDNGALERIVFIEVKTGASALTSRERQIRDAIKGSKFEWLELRHNADNFNKRVLEYDRPLPLLAVFLPLVMR